MHVICIYMTVYNAWELTIKPKEFLDPDYHLNQYQPNCMQSYSCRLHYIYIYLIFKRTPPPANQRSISPVVDEGNKNSNVLNIWINSAQYYKLSMGSFEQIEKCIFQSSLDQSICHTLNYTIHKCS